MKLFLLFVLSSLHFVVSAQSYDQNQISGIYRIELYELYTDKGDLGYSSFFEGEIIISETGDYISAKKIKTNETYFNIKKIGTAYTITNKQGQDASFDASFFRYSDLKLTLTSNANKYYSVYTLHRITDKKELFKKISQGTGFFISSNGQILTNEHVVNGAQYITISIEGKEYECQTVYKNENDDIAVIKIKDTTFLSNPINISIKKYEVGNNVIALGYPLASAMGKELKMSVGIINSNKGFQDDERYFQFSAPIDPGNSGGPVLDTSGNLIGLITSKYKTGTNVGYALKLNSILQNITGVVNFKKSNKPETLSNSSIYSKNKSSIILIKSYCDRQITMHRNWQLRIHSFGK